jgi:hypothetical protein
MPLFMFVRYTAGDEAWHRDQDYANFTLDDPPLQASAFDYAGILAAAQAHNFHFTLALPPARSVQRDAAVVDLFRRYPVRLSLVQHGNNHDGYEFYKYTVTSSDPYPARPYADQVADIREGETRVASLTAATGLPVGRAMVFPYNISPAQTLVYLKARNFLATVNSAEVPLDQARAAAWDSHMYPAEMSYASFAVILRYHAQSAPYPFDLFLDRPAWLYEHKDVFEADGIGWLNPIADAVNGLHGQVEWRSVSEILERLYLEKANDDGSQAVLYFTNLVRVANASSTAKLYHFRRQDNGNVPVAAVRVNGQPASYTLSGGWLEVSATLPPGSDATVEVVYTSP